MVRTVCKAYFLPVMVEIFKRIFTSIAVAVPGLRSCWNATNSIHTQKPPHHRAAKPRMHVIQIIPRPRRARQVPFVPGELHPFAVLVEGGRLLSERVVDVVSGGITGASRDQAWGSQVVE